MKPKKIEGNKKNYVRSKTANLVVRVIYVNEQIYPKKIVLNDVKQTIKWFRVGLYLKINDDLMTDINEKFNMYKYI